MCVCPFAFVITSKLAQKDPGRPRPGSPLLRECGDRRNGVPLVTASPGTCPRWTSRDMAMDDRPSRAGVGGAAREPRACPGGWTPAASPPSLNLPTSSLFEQVCCRASDAPRSPEIARRGPGRSGWVGSEGAEVFSAVDGELEAREPDLGAGPPPLVICVVTTA